MQICEFANLKLSDYYNGEIKTREVRVSTGPQAETVPAVGGNTNSDDVMMMMLLVNERHTLVNKMQGKSIPKWVKITPNQS